MNWFLLGTAYVLFGGSSTCNSNYESSYEIDPDVARELFLKICWLPWKICKWFLCFWFVVVVAGMTLQGLQFVVNLF